MKKNTRQKKTTRDKKIIIAVIAGGFLILSTLITVLVPKIFKDTTPLKFGKTAKNIDSIESKKIIEPFGAKKGDTIIHNHVNRTNNTTNNQTEVKGNNTGTIIQGEKVEINELNNK